MGIDFLTGMTIFIFTLFFVLQFMFGMIAPYTSTSPEHVSVADRVAERLINVELADANASSNVINHTKTLRFFNKSDENISEALGVPRASGVRLSVTGDDVNYGPRGGLVGYWPMNLRSGITVPDANSVGAVEGGLDGEIVDRENVSRDATGVMSSPAFRFRPPTGTTDFADNGSVELPTSPAMNVTDANFSVSFWIKNHERNGDNKSVVGFYNMTPSTPNEKFTVEIASGEVQLSYDGSGSDGTALSSHSVTLEQGAWNHVVVTYDGSSKARLYVNGSEVDVASPTPGWTDDGNRLLVGGDMDASSGLLNASLDELRYYDVPLSDSSVHALYNASSVLSPEEANLSRHNALEETKLVAGGTVPDVASVSSRKRTAYVPGHQLPNVSDHVVGPVEVRVQVW